MEAIKLLVRQWLILTRSTPTERVIHIRMRAQDHDTQPMKLN